MVRLLSLIVYIFLLGFNESKVDSYDDIIQLDSRTFNSGFITKMIEEYKLKTSDLGFAERRAFENNYNTNIEDELTDAYQATRSLEKDLKQLVQIAEILMDKQSDYEGKVTSNKVMLLHR